MSDAAGPAGPSSRDPDEVADALFHALKTFTGASLTGDAITQGMDSSFQLMRVIKQLGRQPKIKCVWRLTQLGAFPLVVAAMIPGAVTYSLSCTLLGIVLEDDDLLSHKIGKTLAADDQFLKVTEAGIRPSEADGGAHTSMLVAQMLNNLIKTASAASIRKVCAYGSFTAMYASVLQQASLQLHAMDWRFPYLVADTLMLMELDAGNHAQLDKDMVGESAVQLLSMLTPNPICPTGAQVGDPAEAAQKIAAVLYLRPHFLHRLCAIFLLYLGRQAVVSDERNAQAVAVAEAVLTNAATAPGKSSSTQGPHSMRIVAAAIAGLVQGDFGPYEAAKTALTKLVRDWEAIETTAEGKIRSPEFQQQVHKETQSAAVVRAAGRIQAVLTKKTSGNAEFKAGSFDDAVVTYNDALKDLKVLQDDETIDMDTATSLEQEEAKLCNNLAECHLRLGNFEAAAEAASDALDADPSQVKGYYRRAKAQAELGRPGPAMEDLQEVLRLQPDNAQAKELREKLELGALFKKEAGSKTPAGGDTK